MAALIVAMVPMPIRCLMHLLGGHADGFRETADRAGEIERDFALARGGGVGAGGAAIARQTAAANRGSLGRASFFVPRATAGGIGRAALAVQLTLFAIAQQRIGTAGSPNLPTRFGFSRLDSVGRRFGGGARGGTRSRPGRPKGNSDLPATRGGSSTESFRFCSCLRRCSESGLLPLAVATQGVGRQFQVGLLRRRLLNRRLQRRLLHAGHGGQLEGSTWTTGLGTTGLG